VDNGIRKPGPGEVGVRNSPVDCFLGRGRIQVFLSAVRQDCEQKHFLCP